MRYRLRSLLIVLALGPPVLAIGWWKYSEWRTAQAQRMMSRTSPAVLTPLPRVPPQAPYFVLPRVEDHWDSPYSDPPSSVRTPKDVPSP